jgi:murein DD-endopeptidase MepM/ murein hydrolase activator NlpD
MATQNLFTNIWKHRVFISVALTETSASRGVHLRSTFLLLAILVGSSFSASAYYFKQGDKTAVIDVTQGEIQTYKHRITELEEDKKYQKQQFNIFAQELGTLQARLERFDAISEKIINDKDLGKHLQSEEGEAVSGQGSATGMELNEETKTLNELKLELSLLDDAADHIESVFNIGMDLISENYINNLNQPYTWPAVHKRTYLSSKYGWRTDPFNHKKKWHSGVDIAGGYNAPIVSSAGGLVVFSGYRYGYGVMVEILHAGGYSTRYGHMNKSLAINGTQIKAGEIIGLMGSTGRSTGPHLHFEVLLNDKKVDPMPFIRGGKEEARRIALVDENIPVLHASN